VRLVVERRLAVVLPAAAEVEAAAVVVPAAEHLAEQLRLAAGLPVVRLPERKPRRARPAVVLPVAGVREAVLGAVEQRQSGL